MPGFLSHFPRPPQGPLQYSSLAHVVLSPTLQAPVPPPPQIPGLSGAKHFAPQGQTLGLLQVPPPHWASLQHCVLRSFEVSLQTPLPVDPPTQTPTLQSPFTLQQPG